ncbi:MAG TPA: cupredoxin domain-containing protein [Candidatus Saccharimonadales bacterium]|nr:cupredoxin domain-containing protein [Candidatus Saccharimonadales bacterium]
MKHPRILIVSSILLVIAGVGAVVFWQMRPQATGQDDVQQTVATEPIATKPVATNTVSIQNYAFSPQVITVKKGRTVIWTNNDSASHTLVFDDTAIPNSGPLNSGAGFSLAFDHAGTFTYHSLAYPDATGTVIVTDRTD